MPSIEFVANDLCLDLVNTEIIRHGEPVDLLVSFKDLLYWLDEAGLVSDENIKVLKKWNETKDAEETLRQIKVLRGTYRQLAEDLIEGKKPSQTMLKNINTLMSQDSMYPQLKASVGGYKVEYVRDIKHPNDIMPVLAALPLDLLTEKDLSMVRKCGNPACIRFFYDNTKNHKRRWCSMDACGNRMKVQRFRQRNKS